MSEDAEVIIKISGDTKNFDSKYMELVKKYKNKEVDLEITAKDLGKEEQTLSRMNRETEILDQKYGEINQKIKDQEATLERIRNIPRDYTTEEGRKQNIQLENEYNRVNRQVERQKQLSYEALQEIIKQGQLTDEQQSKVNKLNAKYEKQKNDLSVISQKIQETGNTDIGSKIDGANNSISKTIKSVSKWGLAIFGVRSAYLGIRRIVSGVLSQNTKLGDQMSALGKSFANAFAPVVERIINLIRTLMAYINYVWQRLFGKNLFSDKVKKDLKSGANSAKEIRKQLAGFDEANVLSDNKTSGGGAGGGTTDIGLAKVKIPDWLVKFMDWVKEHPKLAGILFGTIAFTLFGGWKIAAGLATGVASLLGISGTGALATGAAGLLGALHVLTLLAAAVWLIKLDYDAISELNKELDLLAQSYANNKKWIKMTDNAQGELNDRLEETTGLTDDANNAIQEHIKNLIDEVAVNKVSADTRKESKKQLDETIKGYSDAYKQGKLTEDQEKDYAKFIRENLVGAFAAGSSGASQMEEDLKALDKKYGTSYYLDIQEHGLDEFGDKLKKTGSNIDTFLKKWQKVGDKVLASFNITSASQYKAMFHASGGIVNLPGRGVPVTHYAGEAGREGIVPMDNESQMQLLGQAIAKYVNINNVVNNYMDARKINSILQASANSERLANNG